MTGDARAAAGLRRLRTESDRFVADLAGLAPDDWERPTNCPPWTVRLLAAHLIRGAESYLASLERGLEGILEPYMSREQRTARMHEIAGQPTETILADLRAAIDRFEREFGALQPEQLDTLGTHPYGPRPARWFIEQRLAEVAFHRWDLEHSLGRKADLDPETAAFLLPMLLEQNLPAIAWRNGFGGAGRFRFAVRDDPDTAWLVVTAANSAAVERDGDGSAEVTIEGDLAALALLLYGRRRLPELEHAGRLTVSGDRTVADRFHDIFRGP